MTGYLVDLAALGPDGEYRTRNREIIKDTAGVPVAESCVVPRLFVNRSIDAQRSLRPLQAEQRADALTRAADVFVSSTIAGLDFDNYVELTCRVSGLPVAAPRAGGDTVARTPTPRAAPPPTGGAAGPRARPRGARPDGPQRGARAGGAVWVRRGEVLAVHA